MAEAALADDLADEGEGKKPRRKNRRRSSSFTAAPGSACFCC
jgi:hypothetical protein